VRSRRCWISSLIERPLCEAATSSCWLAYGPDWSQPGDYYAPDNTAVQPLTPEQQNLVKDGDYYAPSRTIVEQPTPEQLKQDREGDYYAPVNGE
jgi:hypothetical protein